MKDLSQFLGLTVDIELTGDKKHTGILMDFGLDILVIYNGMNFLYIPITHVEHLKLHPKESSTYISKPTDNPTIEGEKELSYRNILNNAKGLFVEIYVVGNMSIHGYITNILTNYFVFYSPVYKTMFIPLFHLKWLIPYMNMQTPYSLDNNLLPVHPSNISLARTFEEQLKKLEGKIVVFDLGLKANKMGLLTKIEKNIAELVTAGEEKLYCNVQHIKAVHSPYI